MDNVRFNDVVILGITCQCSVSSKKYQTGSFSVNRYLHSSLSQLPNTPFKTAVFNVNRHLHTSVCQSQNKSVVHLLCFFFYQKPSELLVSLGVRLSVIASFITFWYSPAKLLLKLHCKWNLACQWWFLGRADLDLYEWSWPLWGGASNEPKNGKFDKYF
jgi:hypothetical protein